MNGVTSKSNRGSVLDLFLCSISLYDLDKEYEWICQQQSSKENVGAYVKSFQNGWP